MIFLDFLWLFICMVLIDSRPMLKSMHNVNNLKGKVLYRGHIPINSDNNAIELQPKAQLFHKKGRIKRKLIREELDLTEFRKLFNNGKTHNRPENVRHPYRVSHKNISNMLDALTTEIRGLKHLYGLDETSPSTFIDDVSDAITQKPPDFSALDGTAEIEAALNEIKQRSIQMMVEQLPSVAEIVTSTVTQTTFEVGSTENYSKLGIRRKKACQNRDRKLQIRSIKCDAVTLANKIECILQKKLKNAYCKVKQKIENDFKKEVNETRSTIKAELTKISKGKSKCPPKKTKCKNCLPGTTHLGSKELIRNKTTFLTKKTTISNLHDYSIPKTTDDYSMLSIYEQLLIKPHSNTILDKLVTPNMFIKERKPKDKLSKRNLVHTTVDHSLENNVEKSCQYDDIPDIGDYNEPDLSSSEATTTNKHNGTSSTANDMSMEALSNKISYNDYVNGFKYYLKFQRDQENENFSNLVRYQAHKHHNVDDVGKFILNKLPQLPSTRSKRFLFEQETLEDQDISTKSDDSWFKKHFYFFIDKDPPKKFHTTQTVSLKSGSNETFLTNVPTEMSPAKDAVYKSKHKKPKKLEKKKTTKHLVVRSDTNKLFDNKENIQNCANSNKKAYVDITMVQKPSETNKTHTYKDHHRLRFFHKKSRFDKKHKNSKREILYRKTRFNPFKGLKDIFKNTPSGSNTVISKIFDYEVISSSSNPFTSFNFGQNPNIEAMIRQIPNITDNLESFDFDDNENFVSQSILGSRNYLHNDEFYNTRLKNDNKIHRFSNLHENQMEDLERSLNQNKIDNSKYYIAHNKRLDDIINVRIKTDAPLINPWNITLPLSPTANRENDDLHNLAVSITYIGDDPLKRFDHMPRYDSSNNIDYDNVKANFHRPITDINDMNNIYQKYYQNIPFRLTLPQTTRNNEIEDEKYSNNDKHKEGNVFSYDNNEGNRFSSEKEMGKNCKLYNVQLFKNGLMSDNSQKYNSFDRNKLISSAHLKPMKDASLLPHTNLRIQDRMRYQNDVKQNNNVLNEKIRPFKTVVQRKPEIDYITVTKRLPMNHNNIYEASLKTIKHNNPNVDNNLYDNYNETSESDYDIQKRHNKMKVLNRRYTAALKPNILHENEQSFKDLDSSSLNNHIISKYNAPSGIKKISTQFTNTRNNKANNKNKLLHDHRGLQKAALTQISKVPQQYFITPLPMDADDFDRFLKEHEMDVESVTASLKDGFISNKSHTKANRVTKPFISYVRKNYPNNKSKECHKKRKRRINNVRLRRDMTTIPSKLILEKSKNKREVVREHTFTAKDVAALEIVIDLSKNNQAYYNENKMSTTQTERMSHLATNAVARDKEKLITNAIQVHIALPGNSDNRKRSAESVQVRKVFSAKFSTPVDLEYQINSFENETSTQSTVPDDAFSPGVYLLIENSNLSDPSGKLILRPMQIIKKSDIKTRKIIDDLNYSYSSTSSGVTPSTGNLTKIDIKRTVKDRKSKRYIKWDPVKKFFGHERVCQCRCKANQTMCKPCAAGDVIISELVFELDNLAKFMQDHCTEIQTFFWMNPTGGKKLREVVNKIDKSLNHYYKRVKGKCQGRPCKMFSSGIDKKRSQRDENSFDKRSYIPVLVKDLNVLADNLENANILDVINCNVQYYGQHLMHIIHNCMPQVLKKRSSYIDLNKQTKNYRSVYSLDNVNVNLICSPRQYTTYSPTNIESTSTLYGASFKSNPRINSYDYENYRYKMDSKTTRRGMKNFFKRRFHSRKDQELSDKLNKKYYIKNIHRMDKSTMLPEVRKLFWPDSIQNNINQHRSKRKIKTDTAPIIKVLVKEINNGTTETLQSVSIVPYQNKTVNELNEINNITTELINLDQLLKNINDGTNNLSLIDNLNALFNLLGSNIYDSYTQKLDINKTKRKPPRKQKKVFKINRKYQTNSLVENGESNRDKSAVKSRLRNVTKHFMDIVQGRHRHSTHDSDTLLDSKYKVESRKGRNITMIDKEIPLRKLKSFSDSEHISDVISSMTTNDSPTIIIIDDNNHSIDRNSTSSNTQNLYDNDKNEGIRSLLLSILNFNSKILNNEWVKASKVNYNKILGVLNNTLNQNTEINDEFTKLSTSDKPTTINEKRGIIDKIAHKFSWNYVYSSKEDEAHSTMKQKTTKANHKSSLNKGRTKNDTESLRKIPKKIVTPSHKTVSYPTTKTTKKIGDKKVRSLCDIASTIAHVICAQREMNKSNFEQYVKNVKCYKYQTLPAHFLIKASKRKEERKRKRCHRYTKLQRKKRRCFYRKFIENKREGTRVELDDDYDHGCDESDISSNQPDVDVSRQEFTYKIMDGGSGVFEKYRKGLGGIYEPMTRNKRDIDSALEKVLTNLSPLRPLTDEVFIMVGDSFTTDCASPEDTQNQSDFIWTTDRKNMLNIGNVFMNGSKIVIENAQIRNYGMYSCYRHSAIVRSVKLNVVDVPNFDIVLIQLYTQTVPSTCSYNDLRAIQNVGSIMTQLLCGNYCSVRIDEPVCLKDRVDNSSLMRIVPVISFDSSFSLSCSVECQRDLKCSLALLIAKNAPALATISVIMLHNEGSLLEEIKTWEPSFQQHKYFVTHTLRRKDSNGHTEYHTLASNTEPANVHIIILCPAGFFLVSAQKICSVCPSDFYSSEGANICIPCAKGWTSEPGSQSCHLSVQRLRRSTWPWESFLLLIIITILSFLTCYGVLRVIRSIAELTLTHEQQERKKRPKKTEAHYRSRPISPSRVILNRLLRVSSVPHATDSQETHREIWKEKRAYPPLPPIDFDS